MPRPPRRTRRSWRHCGRTIRPFGARDPAYGAALADLIDHADDPVALDVPLLGASPRVLAVKVEQAKLVDWYADLRIAAGRADEVVGLVREQAALRPLDEDSQARLITVYRQIGCRSAAVAARA
jgi:hypothetical protein